MKLRNAEWRAVRLLEFANLKVTPRTWESLYQSDPRDRGWTPERMERIESLTREATRIAGLRSVSAETPPGEFGGGSGVLWRAFVSGVRSYGSAPPTVYDVILGKAKFFSTALKRRRERGRGRRLIVPTREIDVSPLESWPLPPGELAATYETFATLHRRARKRLDAICDDCDLSALLGELREVVRSERLGFAAQDRESISKRSVFFLEAVEEPIRLDHDLDLLFIQTAVDGLWPRFYRCVGCPRFRLDRLRRRRPSVRGAPRFCSPQCRSRHWRQLRVKHDREKAAAIVAELQGLQARRVPGALGIVARKHHLSPGALSRLLAR